jgi:fumarate hydratase subunit alpha
MPQHFTPRVIDSSALVPVISSLIIEACCVLNDDVISALRAALLKEESPYGKDALGVLIKNAGIAKEKQVACCQDTGSCIIFIEAGQEVAWSGIPLRDAVNEGVRRGYGEGFLRKSMAGDPLERVNTGDNTPAILHTEIVTGDKVKITVLPKGGGCENMSAFTTLLPSAGWEGVKDFALRKVEEAGGKPCPPIILGVGIGGSADYCALLAKKALLRKIGERNKIERYAALELELLEAINKLGIGPLGMGGRISALDVHIEAYPCHITALPVAVCFQCHAARVKTAVI